MNTPILQYIRSIWKISCILYISNKQSKTKSKSNITYNNIDIIRNKFKLKSLGNVHPKLQNIIERN